MSSTKPLIGVVGPCKAGKSTLVRGLQQAGFQAIQIAQEHSFAPSMWKQLAKPDVLIYLHCGYETSVKRGLNWMHTEYDEQLPRLEHARKHANLEIKTDDISVSEVLSRALEFVD